MAYDWRGLLLEAISAPLSELNVSALQWWAESEGMPAWENNWLATTIDGFGGRVVNSAGVKAYPSVQEGVAATAATLRYGAYRNVVAAFQAGQSLVDIWSAINSSPWCSRCQNGLYPVVLFDNLHAVVSGAGGVIQAPGGGSFTPDDENKAIAAWGGLNNALIGGTNYHIRAAQSITKAAKGARK